MTGLHSAMKQHMQSTSLRSASIVSVRILAAMLLCLVLSSCGTPNKRYLLQLAPPDCDDGFIRGVDAPVLMLDDFTTMPGMDRTAVFLSEGNVIQPSTIWYWEGNPAEVMTQAANDRLSCEGPYRISWPYFSEVDHVALLRGRVREFNITSDETPVFSVRMTVELWSPKHRKLLAEKVIKSSATATALTPHATALAASKAVAEATREISIWLEATKSLVQQ